LLCCIQPTTSRRDELYIRDGLIASRRRDDSSPGIGCPVPLGGETRWQLQVLGSGPVSFWINSFLAFPRRKKKPRGPPHYLFATCSRVVRSPTEWYFTGPSVNIHVNEAQAAETSAADQERVSCLDVRYSAPLSRRGRPAIHMLMSWRGGCELHQCSLLKSGPSLREELRQELRPLTCDSISQGWKVRLSLKWMLHVIVCLKVVTLLFIYVNIAVDLAVLLGLQREPRLAGGSEIYIQI